MIWLCGQQNLDQEYSSQKQCLVLNCTSLGPSLYQEIKKKKTTLKAIRHFDTSYIMPFTCNKWQEETQNITTSLQKVVLGVNNLMSFY